MISVVQRPFSPQEQWFSALVWPICLLYPLGIAESLVSLPGWPSVPVLILLSLGIACGFVVLRLAPPRRIRVILFGAIIVLTVLAARHIDEFGLFWPVYKYGPFGPIPDNWWPLIAGPPVVVAATAYVIVGAPALFSLVRNDGAGTGWLGALVFAASLSNAVLLGLDSFEYAQPPWVGTFLHAQFYIAAVLLAVIVLFAIRDNVPIWALAWPMINVVPLVAFILAENHSPLAVQVFNHMWHRPGLPDNINEGCATIISIRFAATLSELFVGISSAGVILSLMGPTLGGRMSWGWLIAIGVVGGFLCYLGGTNLADGWLYLHCGK